LSQELKPLIERLVKSGYQLSPDAFFNLQTKSIEEANELIQLVIQKANTIHDDQIILDWSFFQKVIIDQKKRNERHPDISMPLANSIKPIFEIISMGENEPESNVNGFTHFFMSRFNQLERILMRRVDVKDAISLTNALKMPLNSKLKTIGLVTEKRARGNRLFLTLEDTNSKVTVIASGDEAVKKGLEILNDQVICFDGIKYREDLFIANDFIWPDIPMHEIRRAEKPVCAVFIADIHIGSKYFCKDLFEKFIDWLNLERGNIASRELASRIKYLIISGDLVDGVGVFPNQLEELDITDQILQYEEAAKLLSRLPDYLEIFILPGNHDAVRRSLPQPKIPQRYAPSLYNDKRVHMLSNPCTISLHGVQTFIFHGNSLTDILSSTPGYGFKNPVKALELLVRCRHVAPIYGESTPVAPEKTDRLVINNVPDVVNSAHIHINDTKRYKGVTLISSGGFQSQTPFQKRMNIDPTPGVISIFNLQNHQLINLDLKKMD
jgi:DNA polymerase II small subunit